MDLREVLQRRGLLGSEQIDLISAEINGHGDRLDRVVLQRGLVPEDELLKALADELGMRYVELADYPIDRELLSQFSTTPIFRHAVLPLERKNGRVLVATSDPFDLEPIDELSTMSGVRLQPVLARRDDILQQIKEHFGVGGDTINALVAQREDDDFDLQDLSGDLGELAEQAQQASVIRLVNELLTEALEQKASDVHIEPRERGLTVRLRVDGVLRVQPMPPEINQFYAAIVTRLKIMSRLNIAEKRLPQDGRLKLRVSGREIDIRVSVIPMMHGEGVVLRLLDKERMSFSLEKVGMPPEVENPFRELIGLPHGIVLVTGPTGSGKTTTLYCALNAILSPEVKIITVEDPVEYHMEGISQIQVHSRIGLTFAAGLRSILRHDPDVILIGEIRDGETAQSAIQASLTGHLVFSTLHTNDSAGSFTRLIDMGVEPYLVASTVEGILAQRLVRRLCKRCRREYRPDPELLPPDFPQPLPEVLWEPAGCRHCRETGYSGRIGVYELLRADSTIRAMCVDRIDSNRIRDYAVTQGMTTLRRSGWNRVLDGTTTVDEVLRITKGDVVGGGLNGGGGLRAEGGGPEEEAPKQVFT